MTCRARDLKLGQSGVHLGRVGGRLSAESKIADTGPWVGRALFDTKHICIQRDKDLSIHTYINYDTLHY